MDFKVAGTANGVTALQMDIKIQGITKEIMRVMDQAKEGRLHIPRPDEERRGRPQELNEETAAAAPGAERSCRSVSLKTWSTFRGWAGHPKPQLRRISRVFLCPVI